jgi:uncharacterized membrane protein
MNWIFSALTVSLFYSLASIYTRSCFKLNIEFNTLVSYYFLFNGIIGLTFIMYLLLNNKNLSVDNNHITSILLPTILFAIGTVFLFYTISQKVNLGIMNTIRTSSQVIITLVLGYLYFNEKITIKELIGIVFVLGGIVLVLS